MNNSNIDYSKHLQKGFHKCKFEMNENYKFINKNIFFRFFSMLFYCLVFIIITPITIIMYGIRVKGRRNLKNVKNAVFISNHILEMDFAAIVLNTLFFKWPYTLTMTETFSTPVARHLIKLLRAVPLPNDIKNTRNFLKQTDDMIANGGSLLVFAEGSMWPYFNDIRPFKNGAFRFAVKNDVPIVPIVLSLRKPNKFYRLFGRKKPLITINILKPIYYDKELNKKEAEQQLLDITHNKMKECFDNNSNYTSYVHKAVKEYLDSFK